MVRYAKQVAKYYPSHLSNGTVIEKKSLFFILDFFYIISTLLVSDINDTK